MACRLFVPSAPLGKEPGRRTTCVGTWSRGVFDLGGTKTTRRRGFYRIERCVKADGSGQKISFRSVPVSLKRPQAQTLAVAQRVICRAHRRPPFSSLSICPFIFLIALPLSAAETPTAAVDARRSQYSPDGATTKAQRTIGMLVGPDCGQHQRRLAAFIST